MVKKKSKNKKLLSNKTAKTATLLTPKPQKTLSKKRIRFIIFDTRKHGENNPVRPLNFLTLYIFNIKFVSSRRQRATVHRLDGAAAPASAKRSKRLLNDIQHTTKR